MRWDTSRSVIGAVRDRSGYLWMPKEISGETRWLEFARWQERLTACKSSDAWIPIKWLP